MDGPFHSKLPLSLSGPVLSQFMCCVGHKEEEHDLQASFVAEAVEGGGCDSCDGVRRCGRCYRGSALNDKLEFHCAGGPFLF